MSVQDYKQLTLFQGGGVPCQPHSVAGKRKASGDERDLWSEMRRVIGEIKPRWVVGENVRGLLSSENGRFFRGILRDFAELGYDVGWGVTSAAAIGAIHRRERVAIVAHTNSVRQPGSIHGLQTFQKRRGRVTKICAAQPRYWEYNFSETRVCGMADGDPHRVERLKCLGNAVVPQQFYPVFKAIAEAEHERKRGC